MIEIKVNQNGAEGAQPRTQMQHGNFSVLNTREDAGLDADSCMIASFDLQPLIVQLDPAAAVPHLHTAQVVLTITSTTHDQVSSQHCH